MIFKQKPKFVISMALLGLSLSPSFAHAEALLTIQGEYTWNSATHFLIKGKKFLYRIRKKELDTDQLAKLEKLNQRVMLTIPAKALVMIKPLRELEVSSD